jgi:hypothetical protein
MQKTLDEDQSIKVPALRRKGANTHSGRANSKLLATRIAASKMSDPLGRGLPSLLAPANAKEKQSLDKLKETHEAVWVTPRDNSRRRTMRKVLTRARVIEELAELYCNAISYEERRMRVGLLADWIASELLTDQSKAYLFVKRYNSDLAEMTKSSWWSRVIAAEQKIRAEKVFASKKSVRKEKKS